MLINVYAEEITDRVELVSKTIDGYTYVGVRFYLYLPTTLSDGHTYVQGPFIHREGDDDSSAITFWGKRALRGPLRKALALLDGHYASRGCGALVRGADSADDGAVSDAALARELAWLAYDGQSDEAEDRIEKLLGTLRQVRELVALDSDGDHDPSWAVEAIQKLLGVT